MQRLRNRTFGVLCGLCVVQPAAAIDSEFFALQGIRATGLFVPLGATFDRDQYVDQGAEVRFKPPLFDQRGNYLVTAGETWRWTLRQLTETPTASPLTLAVFNAEYLGGEGHCWSFGACGTFSGLTVTFPSTCLAEASYDIEISHNGQSIGRQVFSPTRFNPEIFRFTVGSTVLHPEIPSDGTYGNIPAIQRAPDSTVVTVRVTDDRGCGVALDEVLVRVRSEIVRHDAEHSHLHTHFMAMERGTSRYSALSAYPGTTVSPDQPDPSQAGYDPSVVEGQTLTLSSFNRGVFATSLTAGFHGVSERVIAEAWRPAQDGDRERRSAEVEQGIDIRVPTLARMAADTESDMVFADGGSCPHTTGTPGDAEDAAAWVTAETRFALRLVAQDYFAATGRLLSINDGSLPFGGFFDNQTSRPQPDPRDKRCHLYHRIGRDIDINGTDSGGRRLNCTALQQRNGCVADTITIGGVSYPLLEFLHRLFRTRGAVPVPEPTVHYRFQK